MRPTPAYLALGLLGAAAVTYSAYLGGKMVYTQGVGVEPDGVDTRLSPEIDTASLGETGVVAAQATVKAAKGAAQDAMRGELVPHLTGR